MGTRHMHLRAGEVYFGSQFEASVCPQLLQGENVIVKGRAEESCWTHGIEEAGRRRPQGKGPEVTPRDPPEQLEVCILIWSQANQVDGGDYLHSVLPRNKLQ